MTFPRDYMNRKVKEQSMKWAMLIVVGAMFVAANPRFSAAMDTPPWPAVKYTEVKAYAWPAEKGMEEAVLAGMKLADGVINKEGTKLSADQVKRLLAAEARRKV